LWPYTLKPEKKGLIMKARIVICSAIVFAFWMLIPLAALAECPEGKREVTFINQAGKAEVICTPADTVPHIGGAGGGVVFPAVCPDFSQEEVEAALARMLIY
jgi:hypothetical protein